MLGWIIVSSILLRPTPIARYHRQCLSLRSLVFLSVTTLVIILRCFQLGSPLRLFSFFLRMDRAFLSRPKHLSLSSFYQSIILSPKRLDSKRQWETSRVVIFFLWSLDQCPIIGPQRGTDCAQPIRIRALFKRAVNRAL